MGIFGILLMVVGGIVGCVGGIWLLVVAFQQHILWGLGSLFVPFVSLIFAKKDKERDVTELIAFVTPQVLRSVADDAEVTRRAEEGIRERHEGSIMPEQRGK